MKITLVGSAFCGAFFVKRLRVLHTALLLTDLCMISKKKTPEQLFGGLVSHSI